MVALALIPSAAIVAIGVVTWDVSLATSGMLRWLLEVALVVSGSAVVMTIKLRVFNRRRPQG